MVNDAVTMHKCLKGLSPSYLSDKFSTRTIVHDRQDNNLNIPSCKINVGQRAFCYRGVEVWNNLSKDLREIINVKVLKRVFVISKLSHGAGLLLTLDNSFRSV